MPRPQKVALVTGAGSGIGKASSLALAQDRFTVVLAGRRSEPLAELAIQIASAGGNALPIPTDVTSPDSVNALYRHIADDFGRLDLLFNNAGVSAPPIAFDELTPEQWQAVIDTNLTGSFLIAQGAVRLMKSQTPQGGRIINNGSISAHVPRPNAAPYNASKHAITGLTKSISLDYRRYNIACGQIDIGNAATDMAAGMATGMPQADGGIATEPTFNVQHVANTILHIANLPPEANVPFITLTANQMPYIGRG
ncbi:oxidoreductase, short chain dehydrogenase/reductase family [Verrucomicrobiia bacterium DG1235]|nr:oxidoreductase, short chain dehydrogenase/reductase family [Verrucomicrobiae bacterium DG1235]